MPPYSKTTWVDGSLPAIDASKLNKIEQGIFDSLRQDGSTTMSGQLVTTAGSAATPAIAPTGDANTGIFFPAADTIAFGEGGLEAMRINSSGQVGIGTISPTALVSMHGSPQATSGAILTLRDTTATGANTTYGAISFLSSPGTDFSIGKTSENANSALAFRNANTGAEFMRIDSNGYVSIGATSAGAAKLRVEDASSAKIYSVRTGGATLLIEGGSASGFVKTITNSNLNLGANNTDYMTITTAGNVGIGTAAPADKLHVVGNIYLGTASQTIYTAGTGNLTLQTNTGNIIFARNNAADTTMFLNNSGNVGIGTTNPLNSLQILKNQTSDTAIIVSNVGTSSATTSMSFVLQESASPQGWLRRYRDGSGLTEIGYTNDLAFSGNVASTKAERMRITSAGHVGIGISSPDTVTTNTKVLHVEGQNYGIVLTSSITNAVKGQFITDGNGPWVAFGSRTNHSTVFTSNDISRLIIEAGGTTRPSANNTYDLGSSSFRWATIYAQNALNTSDARLKTDVAPSSLGLDFIASLNPVQYRWIEGGNSVEKVQTGTETIEISPAIPAQPEVLDEEGNVIQEAKEEVPAVTEERPVYKEVVTPREGVRTHFGLIAQEVKAALPDGLDFAGWCLANKDDPNSTQSLGYTQLIAPMIKAIQELNAKVEALEAQLNK